MGTFYSPKMVTDGLVLMLDAGNSKSYPGSGTTWYDLSGNDYDWPIPSGIYNSSGYMGYNATGNSILSSRSKWQTNKNECTIELWYYPVSGGIYTGCCDTIFGRYYFRFFQIDSSLYMMMGFANPDGSYNTYQHPTYSVGYDMWHHAVGMRRSDRYIIWIDGVEMYNTTFGTGLILYDPNENWEISSTRHTNLRVASSKIYNRGLSDVEILQNFNTSKGRFGL